MTEYRVEMPGTDAIRVFTRLQDMRAFLATHGSPATVYDRGIFTVPAFAAERQRYSAWKQAQVDCHGS
tara:strand:+ start:9788 stop:9991 length:204 start_codon:yes stop_codon:yes gene_type:complete